jgi:hypothetical protein
VQEGQVIRLNQTFAFDRQSRGLSTGSADFDAVIVNRRLTQAAVPFKHPMKHNFQ